jgi:SPP1 family predicted phage head-tail adaptor
MSPAHTPVGTLRRRVIIQAPVPQPDDAGGAATSWTMVAAVFARIKWVSGIERWRAGRFEQAARIEAEMRWRDGMTAGMRLTDGARQYEIISVGDPDGRRTRLICLCEEISP